MKMPTARKVGGLGGGARCADRIGWFVGLALVQEVPWRVDRIEGVI